MNEHDAMKAAIELARSQWRDVAAIVSQDGLQWEPASHHEPRYLQSYQPFIDAKWIKINEYNKNTEWTVYLSPTLCTGCGSIISGVTVYSSDGPYHFSCFAGVQDSDLIPVAALEAVIAELEFLRNSAHNNFLIAQNNKQVIEAQSDFATEAAYVNIIKKLRALLQKETQS